MQPIQQFPSWFAKQKRIGKLAILCAGLPLLYSMCSVPIAIFSPATPTPEVTKTTVATIAPTETNVPTMAPSTTPQPTATEESTALLPGLMAANVAVILEQRGFTCDALEQVQIYYDRTCTKESVDHKLLVEIYGREAFAVDWIQSSVLQFANPDTEFAASFLGFMASMPYDGAVQEEARNWVETTLPSLTGKGDVREKVFAGVKYRLSGKPTAFILEMGDLP